MAGKLLTFYLLALWILRSSSVNLKCLLCCCQNGEDDCESDPNQQTANPVPPPGDLPDVIWRQCNARPPNGQKWACEDDRLDFPTVDCLVQDIRTCDLLNKDGAPTVFYSFGVATKDARPNVRDKLNPHGVMFNDGLMSDADFWPKVVAKDKFKIADPTRMNDPSKRSNGLNRNDIFVARMSEALARASTNDVYVVYKAEVAGGGKDGDLGGIYQLPLPIDLNNPDMVKRLPNAWRTWEFPTIQKATQVQKVYGVDQSKNYPLTNVEWTRGTGQKELPDSYASDLELPPLAGGNSAKFRRDDNACPGAAPSPNPTPTDAPKCTYMGPEPPTQPSAYCTCDGKSTLPLTSLKTQAPETESCAYTAQPTGDAAKNPNKAPEPTTNSKICEVCTPYAANEADCTKMPNCTPIQGAATVEAGSSAVNVGTLTSDALYTSVSKALESICPPATQTTDFTHCSTDTASIKGIKYVADESLLDDGEFVVTVKSSQYNMTSLRDALIQSAATTAKFSTSEKNSYTAHYTVLEKRWWHAPANLAARALGIRDHPYPESESMTLYRAVDFAGAHYYSPFINVNNVDKGTDYIDVDYSFKAGSGAELICDFLNAMIDGLAVVAPEFAVGDIELGSAIDFLCKEGIEGDLKEREVGAEGQEDGHFKRHAPLTIEGRDEI
ncbi:uncharacterized protein KY384_006850 [Bacidia gigantensis]|uniref:uncharacterized protein n=1 Tax=Bacidia gigantensis TaxID=2732470 RepID=UPI001D059AFD|nr:uncharacterized protein KY384_006850 [Bacidia gigantensis]KAG8527934.1 hypothetical protein KY384_006850 [Bacidia gigantensis]